MKLSSWVVKALALLILSSCVIDRGTYFSACGWSVLTVVPNGHLTTVVMVVSQRPSPLRYFVPQLNSIPGACRRKCRCL